MLTPETETSPTPVRDELPAWAHFTGVALMLLAFPLLLWLSMPDNRALVTQALFMPFHTLSEVFAVVVAMLVFVTGWHVHDERRPTVSVMLACAFLAVGLLDFGHLMSYHGMADFLTPNTPHKAIVFWLAARYAAAFALLAYALMPHRALGSMTRYRFLGVSLLYVVFWFWIGIAHETWVPPTFIEGEGLTSFKIALETGVVVLYAVALALIWLRRVELNGLSLDALLIAMGLMLAGELFFMLYSRVSDLSNMLGHVYKVLAYLFIYRAIFIHSVREPILRLRLARNDMAESERHQRELLETAPDAILIVDQAGHIQMVNTRLEQMFGYSREALLGQKMEILLPERYRAQHAGHRQAFAQAPRERPMAGNLELAGCHRDGHEIPLDISLSTFHSEQGTQVTAFIRDVTAQRQMQEALRYQATHDALTALPNRNLFQDRLAQAMSLAKRHERLLAVVFIDMDNFKAINDGWGHAHGDTLLIEVAQRLRALSREGDSVARLGGDEFALLLSELAHAEDAGRIAERVLKALSPAIRLEQHEVFIGASLGVTVFPADGDDVTTLLRNADMAMYQAKSEGRGCVRFFTADLDSRIRDTLVMQTYLKYALENGEFELHYQPQVEMRTGRVCGVEALLRWRHPELGDVSPARFIPVAEASGLIVPLGAWVLETACRQCRDWQSAGMHVRVAVNLSSHQFRQPDFSRQVHEVLQRTGAMPHLLELELTESAVMDEPRATAQVLGELEKLGVQIAIDDFGTGYSSLAWLKTFPLHRLKIDRTFVKDLATDPDDAAIVRGLIGLAHSLGMQVIAEGVEEEDQRVMLARLSCDEYQGWLFSKALPVEACSAVLAKHLC